MKKFPGRVPPRCVKAFVMAAVLVAVADTASAQVWERKYGSTTDDEYGHSVTPIKNAPSGGGGYVEVGRTDVPGTHEDIYIVKVDNNGTTIWQKTYDFGGGTSDVGMSVFECANGDLLVAGTSGDQTATGTCNLIAQDNIFLMRLDEDGNLLWARTFGGRDTEGEGSTTNLKVIETSVVDAGDIVIATSTHSFGNGTSRTVTPDNQITGDRDGFLIRTDANGDLIWAKAYGVPAPIPLTTLTPQLGIDDYFTSVSEGSNGDLIAVGVTHADDPFGPEYPWVVRTSSNGLINPLSTSNFIRAYSISDPSTSTVLNTRIYAGREGAQPQNQDDILMTGACDTREASGASNTELYLLAVVGSGPSAGMPLANLTCGDYGNGTMGLDEGRDLIETSAARIVAVGTTTNLGAPGRGTAVYAIEVNKANNPTPPPLDVMTKMWSRTYGDAWDDQGWAIAEVDNSGTFGTPGLLLGGSSYTNAFGPAHWQTYLLKVFGTNGSTECSYAPTDQFTTPIMTELTFPYEICKVLVQGNRQPTVTVQDWEFDPICND